MPSLRELQLSFGAALLSPGGSPGMQVYRGNVFGNWGKALADAYPIVRKIVGAEFFEGLASQYARANPSASGDLNEYGGGLARFSETFPHTQDLPYLPDVARMEWLAHRSYYAADPAPYDFGIALPEDPRFKLAPPCALLASRWPLGRIWQIHQEDYDGEFGVDLASSPDRILVHRPRWRAQVVSLVPGDFLFLKTLAQDGPLGAALEAAAAAHPAFDASLALARWVDAGVLTL